MEDNRLLIKVIGIIILLIGLILYFNYMGW